MRFFLIYKGMSHLKQKMDSLYYGFKSRQLHFKTLDFTRVFYFRVAFRVAYLQNALELYL